MKRHYIDFFILANIVLVIIYILYLIIQSLCSIFSGHQILLLISVFFIIGLMYWFYHLLTAKPNFADYSLGFKTKKISTYELLNGMHNKELIRMDEYAALSDIVYDREKNKKIQDPPNWQRSEIQQIKTNSDNLDSHVLDGLRYDIWFNDKEEDKTIVAIVFRGTKLSSDWIANFRLIRRLLGIKVWDHYDELDNSKDDLLKAIYDKHHSPNKKLKIVTAGHSLGGGLAQFMAYAVPEINTVYAFNSSPITGYFDIGEVRSENKKDAVIFRIFESGEALSFIRKFMIIPTFGAVFFATKNPKIIRIRFNFKTGKFPWSLHGMNELANYIIKSKNVDKD